MRSYWTRVVLNPITGVLIREGDVGTAIWGLTGHAKTEADTTVMHSELRNTRDCGLPRRKLREAREHPL